MPEKKNRNGQWQIWLMIAMLSTAVGAGIFMFPKTAEQRDNLLSHIGTTNHGEFVLPTVSIVDLGLVEEDGAPWVFSEQEVRWRIVVAGGQQCDSDCRDLLYLTRQVHISLGKYSRRFDRIYLALDGELTTETASYIRLNHPFLEVLYESDNKFIDALKNTNTPFSMAGNSDESNSSNAPLRAYLVDQEGLIMMSYTLADQGSDLIEDITHLMKYSTQ